MAILAFWPAPRDEDVTAVQVMRSSTIGGTYTDLIKIDARDPYDNWVTHYVDEGGTDGDYYKAQYLYEDGTAYRSWGPEVGVVPWCILPQDVVDMMQGLPLNFVDAKFINGWITYALSYVERLTRMRMRSTTVVKEIHGWSAYNKIVGAGRGAMGSKIQLRNKPIIEIDNVYIRVRGAAALTQDQEWEELDIQIEYDSDAEVYNHGIISVVPRVLTTTFYQGALLQKNHRERAVSVLFSYKHGFEVCPLSIAEVMAKYAAAQAMEVAGQAETAGL